MRPAFYDSLEYKLKQAEITRKYWQTEVFNHKLKYLESRICKNPQCTVSFQVKSYSPQKYCSRHCSILVNNSHRVNPLDKNDLAKRYNSGSSLSEIAAQKNISIHKVTYWMSKYGISRRSLSEATYTKRNPFGDPFKIVKIDTVEKIELLTLGIGLFLGEGNKRDNHHVRFANSDPKIIRLFLTFLRQLCSVNKDKIRATLNIFDDLNYTDCLKYWVNITKITESSFYKPTIRPGKIGTYKNKSKYGTITILVSNKKLLDQIKLWCNNYLEKYAEVVQ